MTQKRKLTEFLSLEYSSISAMVLWQLRTEEGLNWVEQSQKLKIYELPEERRQDVDTRRWDWGEISEQNHLA